MANINLVLDIILIVASLWMVFTVRGIGGVVGRTLSLIVIGAVITGLAHLLATIVGNLDLWDGPTRSLVHRAVVLVGFLLVVIGFGQVRELKA